MTDVPAPPDGLLKAARERWTAFWTSDAAKKVDLNSDMPRLIRWIEQSDEYDRVAKVCRKSRLVKGSQGQPVLNPLINYLTQLESQLSRTEGEFGMTPLARQRLRGPEAPAGRQQGNSAASEQDRGVAGVLDLTARIGALQRKATG